MSLWIENRLIMPIYTYRCKNCKYKKEIIVSVSLRDCSLRFDKCERCGIGQFERLIEKSNFALKGSGWAKDGYDKKPIQPEYEIQKGESL